MEEQALVAQASLIRALDDRLHNFAPGDVVTVREHVEWCEVLEVHDPQGDGERFAGVCVPGLLLCLVDNPGLKFVVEPRDLSLVLRPGDQ